MSSRLWAAKNGFSPREAFRRAFRRTESGSPMALRNRPAAESTWLQPPAVPPIPVASGFYRAQSPVWSPDGRICCSGRSASATRRPRTTSTGTWRRSQAGRPSDGGARGAAPGEVPGVSGTAIAGCLGSRGKPHPLSRQRRRLLEHVAGGHLSGDAGASRGRRNGRRSARRTKRRPRSTSDGRMVFISRTMGADIWSLPIDANRGRCRDR